MSVLNILSSTLIQKKNDSVWGSQECGIPPAFQVKQGAKVMVWGGMTGRGLTSYTCYPQAKP